MNDMVDLIPEFVEESFEHLKNIEEDIIQIEQGEADKELINRVFRAVHSIKGGSSFLGLKNIERLSHKMEDIFNMVRNGDLKFVSSISSVVLRAIDQLKDLLENVQSSEDIDVSANIRELATMYSGSNQGVPPRNMELKVSDDVVTIDDYKLNSYMKKGQKIFLIKVELREYGQYRNPLDFIREIEKTGEIIEFRVDLELLLKDDSFTGEGIPLRVVYATVLEKGLVAHCFGAQEENVSELNQPAPMSSSATKEKKVSLPPEAVQAESGSPEISEEVEEEDYSEEDEEALKEYNEYLTFTVGDEEYGVTIQLIQEILTLQPIRPVPGSPKHMMGIINLRGDILPVFDFRKRLLFSEREYDDETITLVAKVADKKIGIIVDRISEVIGFKMDQINDVPQMGQIPAEFLIGIGQKEQRFVFLLKLNEIFKSEEVA